MKNQLSLIAITSLFLIACDNKIKQTVKNKEVVSLIKDDKRFLALKDTAQKHLHTFIENFMRNRQDKNYQCFIKSDYVEDGEHEHMWSTISDLKQDDFIGILTDSVYSLNRVKTKDSVIINKKDVEDWIIIDNVHKEQLGGFSTKYLKSQQK